MTRTPSNPIATEWSAHRTALAQWCLKWMVNRTDASGAYTPVTVRGTPGSDGSPIPVSFTDKRELTLQRLQAHFSAWAKPEDVIGVHTIGLDDTCKCVSLDIDAHSSEDDAQTAERNLRYVEHKSAELDRLGLRPLAWDSNGKGGYHLDIVFTDPIPAAMAYRLGQWLVRDWQEFGFIAPPESFPKQESRKGAYGNWLRLIGRHHTRDIWATVRDHESGEWLSGESAAMAVLSHQPVSPAAIPPEAIKEPEQRPQAPARVQYSGSGTDDIETALAALSVLSPDMGYDEWKNVGQALHSVDTGLVSQWDEWSRGSNKYIEGEPAKKWQTFKSDGGIGIGTLIYLADQTGQQWRPQQRQRLHQGQAPVQAPVQATTDAAAEPPAIADESKPTPQPTYGSVRNFRLVEVDSDDGKKLQPEPIPITDIGSTIHRLTDGWPCRVGGSLFVPSGQGVAWLDDADAFGAWVGARTGNPADFKGMPGYHTKREIFAHLRMTAKEYIAVEELPHEPLLQGHYYGCTIPQPGNGERLRQLVDRFSPETDIDRDLILSLFVTPFFGGRGGSRPAFCLTSDEGRGAGKTELALCVADVAGGAIEISANEDGNRIKTRLLSPDAQSKRVLLIDNIKSHKLSSAELESLITAPTISGHRLFAGEGQRPNNLTFVLTMNGCGLSTDMAQRMVTIKLRRPEYSGTWAEDTRRFIQDHRAELIADIIGFLRGPVATLTKFTRWGDWERQVLARLPEPSESQAVIRERQVGVDVDSEESELIQEFFAKQLSRLGYDTANDRVFIPSSLAAKWYGWATGEKYTTARASRAVTQRITEGQIRQLIVCPHRSYGRGFEFWGDDSTGETYLQHDIDDQIRNRGEGQPG